MGIDYTNYFNRSVRRSMQGKSQQEPSVAESVASSGQIKEDAVVPVVHEQSVVPNSVESASEPIVEKSEESVQETPVPVQQARRPVISVEMPTEVASETDVLDDMDAMVRVRQQSGPSSEAKPVQMAPNRTPARPTQPKARGPRTRGETVQLRDFPASLVNLAQREFMNESMSRALAAYLIVHSDIDLTQEPVSDDIAELVKKHRKSREQVTMEALYTRLSALERQLSNLTMQNRELELALAYVIFDRLGYRQSSAGEPSKVELLEDGVMDMIDRLRAEAANARNQDTLRHGRTIR